MTSSEGGRTLKATTTVHTMGDDYASMEATATVPQQTSSSSAQTAAADLPVEATSCCSRTQRKRIIKWLGGVQQDVCCTCSTPQVQRVSGRVAQGDRRQAMCNVCGGKVDVSVSIDGLRRKQSDGGNLFSTSGMFSRFGKKVFGGEGEDTKHSGHEGQRQGKQKAILGPLIDGDEEPGCTGAARQSDHKDPDDGSSDSTETQQSENTLAWLSGAGSSDADGRGAGGNKKPDLGLDEKAARLRRAQKLLAKSGNG